MSVCTFKFIISKGHSDLRQADALAAQHLIRMFLVFIIIFSIFWHQCECTNGNHYKPTNDRCSNFSGLMPNTYLIECPPAKFMFKDEYECYDKTCKDQGCSDFDLRFWCWSKNDFPENFLRKELNISTSYQYKEYNTSFTASFQFNGTSGHPTIIKCDDQWAQTWYNVSNVFQHDIFVPCNTSKIPIIANFKWSQRDKW